jgi:AcrR family transcriptional regulator
MLQEAVRTIQTHGIAGLTLRGVGDQLGVSRTALYRHFADKQALLGAVAAEGFRTLREKLLDAWNEGGRGRTGFDAMGAAYVRFAVAHPAHYRVMFGGFIGPGDKAHWKEDPSADAFQVLVDAIVEQQAHGLVRRDEPRQLALYIWAVVHGVAMIALDGMLPQTVSADGLMTFANERLRTGLASPASAREGTRGDVSARPPFCPIT